MQFPVQDTYKFGLDIYNDVDGTGEAFKTITVSMQSTRRIHMHRSLCVFVKYPFWAYCSRSPTAVVVRLDESHKALAELSYDKQGGVQSSQLVSPKSCKESAMPRHERNGMPVCLRI